MFCFNNSQAVVADKTIYVSGQLGLDLQGQLVPGGAAPETEQVLTTFNYITLKLFYNLC